MKKRILLLLVLMFIPSLVFASTNTYERTNDNLRVNKPFEITESQRVDILKIPSVDASEKIYDFADLYSDSEEADLYKTVSNFINAYSMDMAVVTIDSNPYNSGSTADTMTLTEKYADDFYDYNDFGNGSDYTGVIILVDMENRHIWISSEGSANSTFTSSLNESIVNECKDEFTSGDYYKGTTDIIYLMSSEFNEDLEDVTGVSYFSLHEKNLIQASVFSSLIVAIIATIIFVVINVNKCKMAKVAKAAAAYTNVNGINEINDILVHTDTSKKFIGNDSSSSGTHVSGSGMTHSGGGGSF